MSFYTPFAFRKSAAAVVAEPDIIQTGLVRYYNAGNTASYPGSGTTWTDLMGSGYNLSLVNGPTFTSNGAGSYITFDGSNDYADGNDTGLPSGTSAFTIGVWVYPLTSADFKGIFYYGTSNFNQQIGWFQVGGQSPYNPTHIVNVYGPWLGTFNGTNALTVNAWNLLQLTFNGGSGSQPFAYYTNGTKYQNGNTSVINTQLGGATRLQIAKAPDGGTEYNARYGAVFVYNVALSDSDITTNWNNTKARYGL